MDNSDEQRDRIHAALQEIGPAQIGRDAVLTGWAMVTEWMDTNGERWLTRGYAANKAAWEADGMHHQALYGDWGDSAEDDS